MRGQEEGARHTMPPGTVGNLPSQVSSHSNGVPQLRQPGIHTSYNKPTSPERDHLALSLEGSRMIPQAGSSSGQAAGPAACAVPKPFKKRYLAEQNVIVSSSHNQAGGCGPLGHSASPSPNSATPTPSSTPTPPISPVAAETARACEALLELGRPVEEEPQPQQQRSSYAAQPPVSGPKNGEHLRQAVWKGVVGTLLSQQEKVKVPCDNPSDSKTPVNLTNQCTIRSQQIIDHIIENILVQPSDGNDSSKLNNNADSLEGSGQDNSDRIKASIYESLKNDLLRNEKANAGPRAGDLPINRIHSLSSRAATTNSSSSNNSTTASNSRAKKASPSPPVAPDTASKDPEVMVAGGQQPKLMQQQVPQQQQKAQPSMGGQLQQQQQQQQQQQSALRQLQQPPPALPSSPHHSPQGARDIMRIVNSSLASPLSLGQTSVTITRAPKGGSSATVLPASFSERPSPPPAPSSAASLISLAPGGGGGGSLPPPATASSSYVHSATLILSHPAGQPQQRGLLLAAQPPQHPNSRHRSSPSAAYAQLPLSPHGLHQQATAVAVSYAGGPLLLAQQPPVRPGNGGGVLMVPAPIIHQHQQQQLLQNNKPVSDHVILSATPLAPPEQRPSPVSECGAVNLSMARRPEGGDRETGGENGSTLSVAVAAESMAPTSHCLESGRSARSCKGKRYQEFIEDGRINAPGSRKRRSHRSGEESEEEAAVNLSLGDGDQQHPHQLGQQQQQYHQYHHRNSSGTAALNLATTTKQQQEEDHATQNHWKKKLRTAANLGGSSKAVNGGAVGGEDFHRGGGGKRGAATHSFHRGMAPSGNNSAFDGSSNKDALS